MSQGLEVPEEEIGRDLDRIARGVGVIDAAHPVGVVGVIHDVAFLVGQ